MKALENISVIIYFTFILLLSTNAEENGNFVERLIIRVINFVLKLKNTFPWYPDQPEIENIESYDFVIVGAGPTGSAMANRLSEIPNWKILLLEAGGEPTFLTDIPATCSLYQFTNYDWGYKAEPQDGFCRGCIDKRLNWPHGKCLGGSSNINFMIMVRGHKDDYDKWERLGNPGWSYKKVLPYFKKLEDAHIERKDKDYHGEGGPLTVTDVPFRTISGDAFVEAAQQAGYPYVDYNGKRQFGVSYVQGMLRDGSRCSAEKAYLRPVRKRKNLKIFTDARVTKILINPETKEAYGVRYQKNGNIYDVKANKEVIISAGGLKSPQLLMLSGIGPRKHLEELKIPVLKNLPVGQKMYDHPTFPGLIIEVNKKINIDINNLLNISAIIDYVSNGRGAFSSIGGVEALTFLKLKSSFEINSSRPDVEFIMTGLSVTFDRGTFLRRMFNIPVETYQEVFEPFEKSNVVQVFPMLFHPQSKGYIKLNSSNPFDSPKYFANYLSDAKNLDVKIFIESIRELQKIIKQPALQKYGAKLIKLTFPNCKHEKYDSDVYWECQLRNIIGSLFHQISTCKMGPASDPEAVVDPELRVHGIENLRVADVSIIPVTLSAHTTGPAYLIGEKGSDLIKQSWRKT